MKGELDILFENAMHETATAFRFLEHTAWSEVLKARSPPYNHTTASCMGDKLCDVFYEKSMSTIVCMIQGHKGGVLGIYVAANRLSKSV